MELVASGVVFRHFQVMSNELSTPTILICPMELAFARTMATTFGPQPAATYKQVVFKSDNNVSYFVGVDADGTRPSMLLCGDQNLAINGVRAKPGLLAVPTNSVMSWVKPRHDGGGNFCLADGSVKQVKTPGLNPLLVETEVATNRLAFP